MPFKKCIFTKFLCFFLVLFLVLTLGSLAAVTSSPAQAHPAPQKINMPQTQVQPDLSENNEAEPETLAKKKTP
ncbi:MAG: hypothetical protein ACYDEQ_12885, partial [Desulfocucumaceae bacterium]